MERARRRGRQEWRELTERWRRSDITGVEFARQEGVNPNTFAWWRSELARGQREQRVQREQPLTLVRVPSPMASETAEPVEVVLPGGIVIRVPNSADLQRSADLVAKLLET